MIGGKAMSERKLWGIALMGLLALLIYVVFEPFLLQDKRITIVNPDLPKEFNDIKIAFLTDIHYGQLFSRARLRSLVKRVNNLEADIVLLGGDYVYRSPEYIEPFFAEMKELKATYGIYGVLGNHDHLQGSNLTIQSMGLAGIELIDNRAVWIYKNGAKIKIGGVGDYLYGLQDLRPTINDVKNDDFVILVMHNPDYAEKITTDKIDLGFAGHTHGGQVTLFGIWAPLLPSDYGQKYRTGIVEVSGMELIISNGIGATYPPVRFFARPQIVITTLKRDQSR